MDPVTEKVHPRVSAQGRSSARPGPMVRQQLQDDGQQEPDQPAMMEGGEEMQQKAVPRAAAGRSLEVGMRIHIQQHEAAVSLHHARNVSRSKSLNS